MSYKILENEATADVVFVAKGRTLRDVIYECALATADVMADRKSIAKKVKFAVKLSDKKPDSILFKFLEEMVYIKDSRNAIFNDVKIRVFGNDEKGYRLAASLIGDHIMPDSQKLRTDVKAITLHMFKLERKKLHWEAKVVLDI